MKLISATMCWYVFRWHAHWWQHYFIYFSWLHSAGCWWKVSYSGAKWLQLTWMRISTWSTTISLAGVKKKKRAKRKHFSFFGFFVWLSLFFFLSSVWPCRSASTDSHHYASISLRQILSRRLLLAQCPGWGHLGLCWTRYFYYHGQKIKNTLMLETEPSKQANSAAF